MHHISKSHQIKAVTSGKKYYWKMILIIVKIMIKQTRKIVGGALNQKLPLWWGQTISILKWSRQRLQHRINIFFSLASVHLTVTSTLPKPIWWLVLFADWSDIKQLVLLKEWVIFSKVPTGACFLPKVELLVWHCCKRSNLTETEQKRVWTEQRAQQELSLHVLLAAVLDGRIRITGYELSLIMCLFVDVSVLGLQCFLKMYFLQSQHIHMM